jgi:hypothetical protein
MDDGSDRRLTVRGNNRRREQQTDDEHQARRLRGIRE